MNPLIKGKKIIRRHLGRLSFLRKPSVNYCVDNKLLPSLIAKTPSKTVRDLFNLPFCQHFTQLNQDIFALLINRFRPGYFIEIGANDGFTFSNTLYLEEYFQWKGILVEPNPKYLASLTKRKNSLVVNKAIAQQRGEAAFMDAGLYGGLQANIRNTHEAYIKGSKTITVDCILLQDILEDAGAPGRIDFISIDVEGGEVAIVKQMVNSSRRFSCGCIECNNEKRDVSLISDLLKSGGYKVAWKNQTMQDLFFIEDSADVECKY